MKRSKISKSGVITFGDDSIVKLTNLPAYVEKFRMVNVQKYDMDSFTCSLVTANQREYYPGCEYVIVEFMDLNHLKDENNVIKLTETVFVHQGGKISIDHESNHKDKKDV